MLEPWHVLVTGATGYIGGSVLSTLMSSNNRYLVEGSVSALVRGKNKEVILERKGYRPVLFDDLDSTDHLTYIASHFDVIIGCASGYHESSAKALIHGLAMRKRRFEKDTYYIHTSGTSNLGDQPITGKYHEDQIFSDKEDIYTYMKTRNKKQPYAQRQTDLTVVQTGIETGVKTYIIMSPLIYGIGTGQFNKLSIQVPTMIRAALKTKQAEVIGDGKGEWDHVHISDLMMLYEIIVARVLAGEELPNGEHGIFFSENGKHSWMKLAQGLGDTLKATGICKSEEVNSMTLKEGAERWAGGNELLAELGFASNSRTMSEVSRSFGWKPQKGEQDFKNSFLAEVEEILKEQKN